MGLEKQFDRERKGERDVGGEGGGGVLERERRKRGTWKARQRDADIAVGLDGE